MIIRAHHSKYQISIMLLLLLLKQQAIMLCITEYVNQQTLLLCFLFYFYYFIILFIFLFLFFYFIFIIYFILFLLFIFFIRLNIEVIRPTDLWKIKTSCNKELCIKNKSTGFSWQLCIHVGTYDKRYITALLQWRLTCH